MPTGRYLATKKTTKFFNENFSIWRFYPFFGENFRFSKILLVFIVLTLLPGCYSVWNYWQCKFVTFSLLCKLEKGEKMPFDCGTCKIKSKHRSVSPHHMLEEVYTKENCPLSLGNLLSVVLKTIDVLNIDMSHCFKLLVGIFCQQT